MHVVRDGPPAAELHGADIHLVHLGGNDRAIALLDQRACDSAPAQLAGEREPDRSTADDEDRGLIHVIAFLPAIALS